MNKCPNRGNGCILTCPPAWSDIDCAARHVYAAYYDMRSVLKAKEKHIKYNPYLENR